MRRHRFSSGIVLFLALLASHLAAAPAAAARWQPLPLWGGAVQVAAGGASPIVYAASSRSLYRSLEGGRTWQLVGPGPSSRPFRILGVDPHDPDRLYVVSSDSSHDWGFFRSEGGGLRWRRSDAGLPESVLGVAFDPDTPGRMYAATSRGLYHSSDGGKSWTSRAFAGERVLAVAVAPGDPRVVLASVQTGGGGTILRSADGGQTFVQVLDQPALQFAFDPTSPERVYETGFGALWRSDDLGVTWTGLPLTFASPRALVVTRAGTVLAGSSERGVARSVDGGLTWTLLPGTDEALPQDTVASLVLLDDGVLAGGARGVWKSLADGRGWRASNTGIRGQTIVTLEVAPDADSTLWVSTFSGIFTSQNEGARFQSRQDALGPDGVLGRLAISESEPQVAYAFGCCAGEEPRYGLIKTADGGRSWERLPYTGALREALALAVDPVDPDIVYAGGRVEPQGTACTAARSTDGGATWSCMGPPGTSDLTAFAIDPQAPRTLYGVFGDLLYRSSNRGESWEKVSNRPQAIHQLTVDPSQRNRLFALSISSSGFLRSENGGRTWTVVLGGGVHDLLVDPTRPGRIWAAVETFQSDSSAGRVFRSDDAGRHWTEVSAGLEGVRVVLDLATDPHGGDFLFAGTLGQGLYRLRREE